MLKEEGFGAFYKVSIFHSAQQTNYFLPCFYATTPPLFPFFPHTELLYLLLNYDGIALLSPIIVFCISFRCVLLNYLFVATIE